jgi:hypothetical protein
MIFQNFGFNQNYPVAASAGATYSIDYLIVAGGGGGGLPGGGGAGGLLSGSVTVTPSDIYNIFVGNGGTGSLYTPARNSESGISSSIQGNALYTASIGGGRGGTGNGALIAGGDGGSGGGGSSRWSSGGTLIDQQPGGDTFQLAIYGGYGQDGCDGGSSFAAKDGGAGGTSVGVTNTNCPNRYTPGYYWLDGGQYAIAGDNTSTDANPVSSGGWGGNCNQPGVTGVCAIRYAGETQKATGGAVVSFGGYTYHYFDQPLQYFTYP